MRPVTFDEADFPDADFPWQNVLGKFGVFLQSELVIPWASTCLVLIGFPRNEARLGAGVPCVHEWLFLLSE